MSVFGKAVVIWIIYMGILITIAVAQQPTKLVWEASTTLENGTEMIDLGGYRVYCGPTAQNLLHTKDVGNVTEFPLADLNSECRYFGVTAYRQNGTESAMTNICNNLKPASVAGCSIR